MTIKGTPVTCIHPWHDEPHTFNRVYEYYPSNKMLIILLIDDDPSGDEYTTYGVNDEDAARIIIEKFETLTNIPDMTAYIKSLGEYDHVSF